ncbi:AmmeMemoRadiSam system protein B [Corallincola spongiicola]|uniref:MEMO1 family protein EXY25_07055 n=1 Tax=Corallincola spongiicola TaxID=2520508 RepID=A0ABY1WR10_9GAMM|nr:AmmeMemoRadiSam system protein B [Corallincola spongiicola]TAA46999.1 AmmeMemoRadiSam system protein B [Corallincola spongiicola]
MMTVREAAHAGSFYPDDGDLLAAEIACWLMNTPQLERMPKALIVPHAGYQYSGEVAAAGYAQLKGRAQQIRTVLLLGPNHRVPLHGLALPTCELFSTPLGQLLLDRAALALLATSEWAEWHDEAHRLEHGLEVQLPFLQLSLQKFEIVPVVVGEIPAATLAALLEPFWHDPSCLIVVSSDLSHFESYPIAQRHDQQTVAQILSKSMQLHGADACGCRAINGLMALLQNQKAEISLLAQCNSGDSTGDKNRVVGYASFAVYAQ